ncbi:MAG: pilus assembly protein PilY, partial [Nitrospirae bacterium]
VGTVCANKCNVHYDSDRGFLIENCSSDSYCPSNTIVDFYVDTISDKYGKFRINFEDVEQGADHDMDAIVEYEYCVGSSCDPQIPENQVKIKLNSTYAAGCIAQVMGFVISGSTEDGTYLPVRDSDSNSGVVANKPLSWEKIFTSSGMSSAQLLKNPLWYAAKYGGFKDYNGNDQPDLENEWDRNNDGVPDTYFFVSNPLKLEQQLEKAFIDILNQASSGTAVSILSTTGSGEGAVYQAYFLPQKMEEEEPRTWLGYLHALFVDKYGNLREDTNGNDALDMTNDYIINMRYDPSEGTIVDKYEDSDGDGVKDSDTPIDSVPLEDIKPIWNAGKKLWENPPLSRSIFTTVNGHESIDFVESKSTTLQDKLRATTIEEANNIINWIRGEDLNGVTDTIHPEGFRKRSITTTDK